MDVIFLGGERGIRTLDEPSPYRFSRAASSTTPAPLRTPAILA